MYVLLLSLIYLAFISLGLPDSTLGAGWPAMHISFGVPVSYMGIVSMIISGGTILSSLASAYLTKKFSTKTVTAASVLMTAAAMFGFGASSRFWHICIWAVPYGLGAGAIDAALNNYVALHYSSKHMSWLHCFWGVGTIVSPYVMSYALANSVWNDGYRIVGIVQVIIAVVLIATMPVWKINQNKNISDDSVKVLSIKDSLKIKGVAPLLTGFFAYCAAEATVMLWASTYLVSTRGVSEEIAAAFASLFFIGMTAGRFASGVVSEKFGDRNMIRIGTVIAFVGVLCVALPLKSCYVSLAGFIIIGLGCAPIYPSIIHSTPIISALKIRSRLSAYKWQVRMSVLHLCRLFSDLPQIISVCTFSPDILRCFSF